jgi:hypothetical protein
MAVNRADVVSWIVANTDLNDLDSIVDLVRARKGALGLMLGMSFKPGDKVYFDARNRGIIKGTFLKLNQKNAKIQSDTGGVWTVDPTFLRKQD